MQTTSAELERRPTPHHPLLTTHYPPPTTHSSLGSFPTGMEEAFSGAKGNGIYDRSAIPTGPVEESYRAVFSEGKVTVAAPLELVPDVSGAIAFDWGVDPLRYQLDRKVGQGLAIRVLTPPHQHATKSSSPRKRSRRRSTASS